MDMDEIKLQIFHLESELKRLEALKEELEPLLEDLNLECMEINIQMERLRSRIGRAKNLAKKITERKDWDRVVSDDDKKRIDRLLKNSLVYDGYL